MDLNSSQAWREKMVFRSTPMSSKRSVHSDKLLAKELLAACQYQAGTVESFVCLSASDRSFLLKADR